jgi:hypothetical protein
MKQLEKEKIKCIDCDYFSDGYCSKLNHLLESGFAMKYHSKSCGIEQKQV